MELTNDFRVSAPVDRAWAVLTDIERIAPCMPGADLQEVEGDEYRGVVRVKVGPITAQYKGAARMVEKDDDAHRAVLRAEGRETRGQGNANATISATLTEVDGGTRVELTTDLTVTGRVAQFGRGVLADVSGKLLQQFVDCLEADVLGSSGSGNPGSERFEGDAGNPSGNGHRGDAAGTATATAPATATASSTSVRRIESRPSEPVNLVSTAGVPVVKRAAPIVAVLFVVWWLLRRRKR